MITAMNRTDREIGSKMLCLRTTLSSRIFRLQAALDENYKAGTSHEVSWLKMVAEYEAFPQHKKHKD